MGKEGEKPPGEWPREGAYNLPRLVEAGSARGRKTGKSALPQEEEEKASNDTQAGEDGLAPSQSSPSQGPRASDSGWGSLRPRCLPGKHRERPGGSQSRVQVEAADGPGGLGRGAGWLWDNPAMQTRRAWRGEAWEDLAGLPSEGGA